MSLAWLLASMAWAAPAELVVEDALILVPDGAPLERGDVVVRRGRVAELLPPGGAADIDADTRLAGGDLTVMPGLINGHTHMLRAGYCTANEGTRFANGRQIPRNFDVALTHGQTTVIDLGGPTAAVLAARQLLVEEAGRHPAPRYVVAGPMLTAKGGAPLDWSEPGAVASLSASLEVSDTYHASDVVNDLADAGVDLIKLVVTERGYNGRPLPSVSPAVAAAVVDTAHARGLRVFVYAHTVDGYEIALSAGADVIAHIALEPLPDSVVRRVVEQGVTIIPTLWSFESFSAARADPGLVSELRAHRMGPVYRSIRKFDRQARAGGDVLPAQLLPGLHLSGLAGATDAARANLARLVQGGASIGFGTDAAFCYTDHAAASSELQAMAAVGMGPRGALDAATVGMARALGHDRLGVVAAGAVADLLVLAGDPTRDIGVLEQPAAVIKGGIVVRCDADVLGAACAAPPAPRTPSVGRAMRWVRALRRALAD